MDLCHRLDVRISLTANGLHCVIDYGVERFDDGRETGLVWLLFPAGVMSLCVVWLLHDIMMPEEGPAVNQTCCTSARMVCWGVPGKSPVTDSEATFSTN